MPNDVQAVATNHAQWHDTGGVQEGFAFVEFFALSLDTTRLSVLLVVGGALSLLSGWGARGGGHGNPWPRARCEPRG